VGGEKRVTTTCGKKRVNTPRNPIEAAGGRGVLVTKIATRWPHLATNTALSTRATTMLGRDRSLSAFPHRWTRCSVLRALLLDTCSVSSTSMVCCASHGVLPPDFKDSYRAGSLVNDAPWWTRKYFMVRRYVCARPCMLMQVAWVIRGGQQGASSCPLALQPLSTHCFHVRAVGCETVSVTT
jgi:hypothetical protein